MHPPRRNRASENLRTADRLADWLLAHCPLTALTLLTLVVGSSLGIPRPWQIFAVVVTADIAFNVIRWRRRAKRSVQGPTLRQSATA